MKNNYYTPRYELLLYINITDTVIFRRYNLLSISARTVLHWHRMKFDQNREMSKHVISVPHPFHIISIIVIRILIKILCNVVIVTSLISTGIKSTRTRNQSYFPPSPSYSCSSFFSSSSMRQDDPIPTEAAAVWCPERGIYVGGKVPDQTSIGEIASLLDENDGALPIFGYGSLCWNPGDDGTALANPGTFYLLSYF